VILRRLQTGILLALLAAGLAGCGVRGSLQAPPASNPPAPEASSAPDKPQRPFVLDRIL